jgi:hypothetical protein
LGSIIFAAPFFTSVSTFTSTPIGDHNDHRAQYFTVIGIDVWANEGLELWTNQMGRNFFGLKLFFVPSGTENLIAITAN